MSDEDLRELERTWRRTGDPADEERWHRARVRGGALEGWRLELAETLGWPGGHPKRAGVDWDGLRARFEALARDGGAYDRALVVAGEHVLAMPRARIDDLRSFRRAADELAARAIAPDAAPAAHGRPPSAGLGWIPNLYRALFDRLEDTPPGLEWIEQARTLPGSCGTVAPPGPELWTRMFEALVPWLLGTGDPLRERALAALDDVRVASPCAVPWESMTGDERARTCARCRMKVYDLGALSRAEAAALLRRHEGERLCINYYRRSDGRLQTRDCPVAPDSTPHLAVRGMRA